MQSILHLFNLTFLTPCICSILPRIDSLVGAEFDHESYALHNLFKELIHNSPFMIFQCTTPLLFLNGLLDFENLDRALANAKDLDILFRNCSFLTLFLSMIFYWIQTAFSSPIGKDKTANATIEKKSSLKMLLATTNNPIFFPNQKALFLNKNAAPKTWFSFFGAPAFVSAPSLNKDFPSTPLISMVKNEKQVMNFGTITMIISNFLLIFLLIFRWKESGHFPLSNLYESLMFLSWSCTFIHLVIELKTEIIISKSNTPDAMFFKSLIGSITSPIAFFTNAFATFNLPAEMQKASPLVPALQSNWLMMHVTVMIISYSALILGSLLSIAFLILISSFSPNSFTSIFSRIPRFFFSKSSPLASLATQPKEALGPYGREGLFKSVCQEEGGDKSENNHFSKQSLNLSYLPSKREEQGFGKTLAPEPPLQPGEGIVSLSASKAKMTLAWNFDNLSYRVLGIGFPFLTIGILSGAVWANEAWGSYWSWDPKETWALLTWLIFAIYLHARITKGWQGKKPAIIASCGFLAIWICFLGVNLIGEGLHSYGWFSH